ncbi:phage holin family protein [Microbacterium sp. ASV49]|uniref:Phage holin family protein n=1 Tax=Microbacterium candidum TaxID=3041922 RepID=A0ABT7MY83_9MICO|nr:phage holin family protein [Microbacterium sp. ASV49]MDL9979409.1 phage holin family protein [Microbacterium sp. ASV49]
MPTPRASRDRADDSLLTLLGELPELLRNLVIAEVNAAKVWLTKTAKDAGYGAGWMALALFFLFWSIPVFDAFLIAGLSSWWPVWLSALVVLGVTLVIVAVFALLSILRFRKLAARENPVQSVATDIEIVKDVADEF